MKEQPALPILRIFLESCLESAEQGRNRANLVPFRRARRIRRGSHAARWIVACDFRITDDAVEHDTQAKHRDGAEQRRVDRPVTLLTLRPNQWRCDERECAHAHYKCCCKQRQVHTILPRPGSTP